MILELQKLDILYLEQLLSTKGTFMITWSQLKKCSKLSSKGRKANWFKELENLIVDNKILRTIKPKFLFKGTRNLVAIRPKLEKISAKRSKKEWVIPEVSCQEN
jgi:hypothetical protein